MNKRLQVGKTGYKTENQGTLSLLNIPKPFQTYKSSALDYYAFLEKTMDILFETFEIERGCICLWDENSKEYEVVISRGKNILDPNGNLQITPCMLNKVLNKKISVLTVDAGENACLKKRKSNSKSLMCIPLITQNMTIGFIYIDIFHKAHSFADRNMKFLMALAQQIAISVDRQEN